MQAGKYISLSGHLCLKFKITSKSREILSIWRTQQVQWTQNNSEPELRHCKRGTVDGKDKGKQDGKESAWACIVSLTTFFPLNFNTIGGVWYTDFYAILYFVNQRNYKTLATQAHVLNRTRYFCSLNVIISHLTVYKEGLSCLSVCAIASRSSPPSNVCICNGQPSSELFCVHFESVSDSGAPESTARSRMTDEKRLKASCPANYITVGLEIVVPKLCNFLKICDNSWFTTDQPVFCQASFHWLRYELPVNRSSGSFRNVVNLVWVCPDFFRRCFHKNRTEKSTGHIESSELENPIMDR
jgi:hypothetical protein